MSSICPLCVKYFSIKSPRKFNLTRPIIDRWLATLSSGCNDQDCELDSRGCLRIEALYQTKLRSENYYYIYFQQLLQFLCQNYVFISFQKLLSLKKSIVYIYFVQPNVAQVVHFVRTKRNAVIMCNRLQLSHGDEI